MKTFPEFVNESRDISKNRNFKFKIGDKVKIAGRKGAKYYGRVGKIDETLPESATGKMYYSIKLDRDEEGRRLSIRVHENDIEKI